ncbi:MAG: fumarylacetoacetate hydrolase family protein [Halobacteriota archaeon]|nr:fumarylacetoacetate hydrolase family protein [Halobacteriota archaeon]
MRIARFLDSGVPKLGAVIADKYVVDLTPSGLDNIYAFIEFYPKSLEVAREVTKDVESAKFHTLGEVKFLAPIPRPLKIICLGLNYKDHAEEFGGKPPKEPMLFSKAPTAVIGPDDGIKTPTKLTDYEVELAIVMRKRCSHVSKDEAKDYVFGFTILNDVSARDIQFKDKQFFRSKSFDTFAPIGPWITTTDEIGDPDNLKIECKLNGDVKQSSNTGNMIFSVYEIVSFISKWITLEPGDLIGTGTPSGVGSMQKPPRFLKSGDELELTIENIGTLRNVVQ